MGPHEQRCQSHQGISAFALRCAALKPEYDASCPAPCRMVHGVLLNDCGEFFVARAPEPEEVDVVQRLGSDCSHNIQAAEWHHGFQVVAYHMQCPEHQCTLAGSTNVQGKTGVLFIGWLTHGFSSWA